MTSFDKPNYQDIGCSIDNVEFKFLYLKILQIDFMF